MTAPTDLQPLLGQTALVTGASRGLGRAVAVALGRLGAKVLAVARTQGALEETDDAILHAGGPQASLIQLDLSQPGPLAELPKIIQDRFGGLDILVSNAAYLGELTPVAQSKLETFEKAMQVNYFANLALIRNLDPLLRTAPHGRALFVTCGASQTPAAFWGAYGASKAAMDYLALSYAAEVAHSKLKVALVDPGPMATDLHKAAMPGLRPETLPQPTEAAEQLAKLCLPGAKLNNGARIALAQGA